MRRTPATLLALCCAAPTIAVLAAAPASAATPFGSGDVVVLRDGTGAAALGSTATATFLDDYSSTVAAQSAPVSTVALPTATNGGSLAVTDSGSATSDGQITNSGDGQAVVVAGYDAPLGTTGVASSASTTVPRVIARVGSGGAVDATTSTSAFSGNNIRSATSASLGGAETDLAVGGTNGVQAETDGQSASTLYGGSATANTRVVHVYAGQTFVSGASSTSVTGVGVLVGTTLTQLTGVNAPNPYGFALARTGTAPTFSVNGVDTGLNTVYVADATNGLYKYTYAGGGSWSQVGTPVAGTDYGLAARPDPASGTDVFLTSTVSGTSTLVRLLDSAGSGAITATPVTLATASSNEAFRGVAFTPPTPATSLPEAPYAVLLPIIGLTAIGLIAIRRSARQ